jgi:DNA-directed RNA polymerase delta subunit
MIDSLLDACQSVLENLGEPLSPYWLASQVMEMKMWRASEADMRDALAKDIERLGARSRFVRLDGDEWGLRAWSSGRRVGRESDPGKQATPEADRSP